MGSTAHNTNEQTTQGTAGAGTPEGQRIMQLLGQTAESAAGQMGDLSGIASGNFNLTPEQRALISEAQDASGNVARSQMEQNMEAVLRQLEDSNIGKGITGGSLEAVNQALVGQEHLRSTDQLAMGQQGQAAQMGVNVPFQAAQSQIAGNQALLARLVQPSQTGLNYDALLRQLNSTQNVTGSETIETPATANLIGAGNAVGEMIPG